MEKDGCGRDTLLYLDFDKLDSSTVESRRWLWTRDGTVLGFRLDNAELDFVDGRSLFVS